jgi:hypothetical protein
MSKPVKVYFKNLKGQDIRAYSTPPCIPVCSLGDDEYIFRAWGGQGLFQDEHISRYLETAGYNPDTFNIQCIDFEKGIWKLKTLTDLTMRV